ncbi:MAG: hypothetical protein ACRD2F_14685 [Terriglobales bacterium]
MGFEACLLACPLGALRADSAAGAASQWFTGVDSDVRTDLSDFPFREYSSIQSRWLSPDPGVPGAQRRALGWEPAGLAAVNPANPRAQGISAGNSAKQMPAYAYVGNQPLEHTDPLGLVVPCVPGGSGAGGALGGTVSGAGPVAGAVSSLTMGSVTVRGAGPGLTSLGITSSGEIAVQDGAALTAQAAGTASGIALGIGFAKLGYDAVTFAVGLARGCPQ